MVALKTLPTLADEVDRLFVENKNYLIEHSEIAKSPIPYCIIYFSSAFIYYPNTKEAFYDQIIGKDKYEWYRTRINYGTKHIFIRDIKKKHYLCGINSSLDSIEKVIGFLKEETEGYRIITVGSSSGGFAAVLFGQVLNAERIYCFNSQFVLDSYYSWMLKEIAEPAKKYSDLRNFLKTPSRIFYFHSNKSLADMRQFKYVENRGINILSFDTSIHGIPFFKKILPVVLNLNIHDLTNLSNRRYNPFFFSIKIIGVIGTLIGILEQLQELLHRHDLMRVLKSALFPLC